MFYTLYLLWQPQKMLLTCAGRGEEYVETFKIIQFLCFLSVSVFDDDPKKKLGDFDHNWTTKSVNIFEAFEDPGT
jgi:hypothetical protein